MNPKFVFAILVFSGLLLGGVAASAKATPVAPPIQERRQIQSSKESHPNFRKAMSALKRAKTYLLAVDHDVDGHRARALKAVDQALAECRAAMAPGRR